MSARDELTPERLAEIGDLLRYESSIAFYSHRAKESMLLLLADAKERRAESAENLTAPERQFLTFALDLAFDQMVSGDGFTDEDEAALASLRAMAASSPRTAADEQPAAVEFGVRAPVDVLAPTFDRAEAERRLARTQYPDAVLVERTVRYGPWTEVAR